MMLINPPGGSLGGDSNRDEDTHKYGHYHCAKEDCGGLHLEVITLVDRIE